MSHALSQRVKALEGAARGKDAPAIVWWPGEPKPKGWDDAPAGVVRVDFPDWKPT